MWLYHGDTQDCWYITRRDFLTLFKRTPSLQNAAKRERAGHATNQPTNSNALAKAITDGVQGIYLQDLTIKAGIVPFYRTSNCNLVHKDCEVGCPVGLYAQRTLPGLCALHGRFEPL